MRTSTLLLSALLNLAALHAQNLGEIRGKVLDEKGEPVPFATVSADRGDGPHGTEADEDGRFVIKPLLPGTYAVRIASLGFATRERTGVQVHADKITFLNHERMVSDALLPDFTVIFDKWTPPLIDPEEPSKLTIIASQFVDNPGRKNLATLISTTAPGIYQAPGTNDLYFRGSRSGAMAYFVDGVKVPGQLSGVPPASVASITIYTGGLPARYGDVTGGVVAIETKSYFDLYMQEQAGLR